MQTVILTKEQYTLMVESIKEINIKLRKLTTKNKKYIDNQELLQMLKISKRTLQYWRDSGFIGYSKVGNKFYYKLSDIESILEKHYVKAFK
jgi:hypothetical protein